MVPAPQSAVPRTCSACGSRTPDGVSPQPSQVEPLPVASRPSPLPSSAEFLAVTCLPSGAEAPKCERGTASGSSPPRGGARFCSQDHNEAQHQAEAPVANAHWPVNNDHDVKSERQFAPKQRAVKTCGPQEQTIGTFCGGVELVEAPQEHEGAEARCGRLAVCLDRRSNGIRRGTSPSRRATSRACEARRPASVESRGNPHGWRVEPREKVGEPRVPMCSRVLCAEFPGGPRPVPPPRDSSTCRPSAPLPFLPAVTCHVPVVRPPDGGSPCSVPALSVGRPHPGSCRLPAGTSSSGPFPFACARRSPGSRSPLLRQGVSATPLPSPCPAPPALVDAVQSVSHPAPQCGPAGLRVRGLRVPPPPRDAAIAGLPAQQVGGASCSASGVGAHQPGCSPPREPSQSCASPRALSCGAAVCRGSARGSCGSYFNLFRPMPRRSAPSRCLDARRDRKLYRKRTFRRSARQKAVQKENILNVIRST